jgi:hypothetical protein
MGAIGMSCPPAVEDASEFEGEVVPQPVSKPAAKLKMKLNNRTRRIMEDLARYRFHQRVNLNGLIRRRPA